MPENIQAALRRTRDISIAAIDYSLERYYENVPADSSNILEKYSQIAKRKVEELYQQEKLKELELNFKKMTKLELLTADLLFAPYIKEKTGYDIDLFGNISERVDKIIAAGAVANRKELNDLIIMNGICKQTAFDLQKIETMHRLTVAFRNRTLKNKIPVPSFHNDHSLAVAYSPDKKRKLVVAERKPENGTVGTDIWLHGENCSQLVYLVEKTNAGLKSYWKDAATMVIETKKEFKAILKYEQVEHESDSIRVLYKLT